MNILMKIIYGTKKYFDNIFSVKRNIDHAKREYNLDKYEKLLNKDSLTLKQLKKNAVGL